MGPTCSVLVAAWNLLGLCGWFPGLWSGIRDGPHVSLCRIVDQEVAAELENLSQRLSGAGGGLEALGLKTQMEPFLHVAMAELRVVRASLEGLNQTTATLCDFLCEQPESFNLPECCSVFHTFQEHFLTAVQVSA